MARSLELLGEWWTLLIIREAFYGSRHFGEFEAALGIAPNVLAQRLARLVEGGVLEVTQKSEGGRALAYRLSPKGRDLLPVIVALTQWGDAHAPAPKGPPVRIVERRNGQPIAAMKPRSSTTGRVLEARDVALVAGPGANQEDHERLTRMAMRLAAKAEHTAK
jgi:DNA-binding HxlR family transcriptional regulator